MKTTSNYHIGDVVEFTVGGFGVIRNVDPKAGYVSYATDNVDGLPPHAKNKCSWHYEQDFKGLVATSVRNIEHVIEREDVQAALQKIEDDRKRYELATTTHGVAQQLLSKPDLAFKTTHEIARLLLEKPNKTIRYFALEDEIDYEQYIDPVADAAAIEKLQNLDRFFMSEGIRGFNETLRSGLRDGFCPACRKIGVVHKSCDQCGTIIPFANAPSKRGWT